MNFRRSTIEASAFYLGTLNQSPQVNEGGGYLSYKPTDRLGLKANFLHRATDLESFTTAPDTPFDIPGSTGWDNNPDIEGDTDWAAITPDSSNLYSIQASTAWDKKLAIDLE